MLSDTNAKWSATLGLESGGRTKRYAIILDDLVVKAIEARIQVAPCPRFLSELLV